MTEKRYLLKSDGFLIDTVVDTFENIEMSPEGVVSDLNELYEDVKRLEKENEQLKAERKGFDDILKGEKSERNHWYRRAKGCGKMYNQLKKDNEQLKSENKRMADKLNQLALEFLDYGVVTMGKATEMSEMCYSDFLKYRKENDNPMELQL